MLVNLKTGASFVYLENTKSLVPAVSAFSILLSHTQFILYMSPQRLRYHITPYLN